MRYQGGKSRIAGCCFESGCTLGFDKGRPEDEPTDEELQKFDEWMKSQYKENGNA